MTLPRAGASSHQHVARAPRTPLPAALVSFEVALYAVFGGPVVHSTLPGPASASQSILVLIGSEPDTKGRRAVDGRQTVFPSGSDIGGKDAVFIAVSGVLESVTVGLPV